MNKTLPGYRLKKNLPIFQFRGIQYRACNVNCMNGFKEDRRHGVMYGPYKLDGNFVNGNEFSVKTNTCIYCGH